MDKQLINARLTLTLVMLWLATLMCVVWPLSAFAGPAADRTTESRAATTASTPASTNLGKVQVTGIKQLVRTLQTVKVALKRPFDDNPKHVDDMVCKIHTEMREYGLECGTEGWFSMRRETYRLSFMPTGKGFAGGILGQAAVPTLGHPWHVFHPLNHTQMMYLRILLKKLPAPDSDQKILVRWDSKNSAVEN